MAGRDSIPREALTEFVNDDSKDIFYRGCQCGLCMTVEEKFFVTSERERTYEDLVNEEVTRATGIPPQVAEVIEIPSGLTQNDSRRKDAGKVPLHLVPWDTIKCIASELVNRSPSYEVDDECTAGLPNLEPGEALDNLIEFFQDGAELEAPSLTAADIIGVARVLEFGAKKYSARGWEKGIEYSRTFSSGMRHLFALGNGQENDPETGLPHWHHALCNYLFLVRFSHTPGFEKFDDRPLKSEL